MLYGSQKINAETLCEKRSHQLGEGLQCGAAMPTFHHPSRSVRERPQIRHRNDTVCTPFPISFMEVNNSQQRCHPDTASRGKGQQSFAEMPNIEHPSQPVHRGHKQDAAMPMGKRLAREGSTKACNQQCQSFTTLPDQFYLGQASRAAMPTPKYPREGSVEPRRNAIYDAPFPTSLWANPCTQKCHGVDAHQLGKDIICTLIKPLLFLPFLLIYGSHPLCAEMPTVPRSHQFWATPVTPKGRDAFAQLILTNYRNDLSNMAQPSKYGSC